MAKNKLVNTENQSQNMSGGFVIPYEVVDGIVLAALIESRDDLQNQLDKHFEDGAYLDPEDIPGNREYIYCMNKLITYYGGGSENS